MVGGRTTKLLENEVAPKTPSLESAAALRCGVRRARPPRRGRARRGALEAVGAVSQRAPVGHGARGLQPGRQRLGLLPARSRALAAPTAGARTASPASATTSQRLCLALAFWNGRDPILKERLFGLTNGEGNHGEDVKELYYYLDATPTHSYLKMLYKYPQREFPYDWLGRGEPPPRQGPARVRADRHRRLRRRPLFRRVRRIRQGRARGHPDAGHGAQPRPGTRRPLHLLPQLWFRNTWSWRAEREPARRCTPTNGATIGGQEHSCSAATLSYADGEPTLLFCDNDTNVRRLFGMSDVQGHFKDAFHEYLVAGRQDAGESGASRHQGRRLTIGLDDSGVGGSATFPPAPGPRHARLDPFADFDEVLRAAPSRGRRVLRRAASRTRRSETPGTSSARPSPA